MSTFVWIIIITAIAGVCGTGFGGLLGAVLQRNSTKIVSLLLAFAGGVMMAVVCFDLIPEAFFPDGAAEEMPLFIVINSYTTGLAPSVLGYMLSILVKDKFGGKVTWDELGLPVTETGLALPCGATGRWCSE